MGKEYVGRSGVEVDKDKPKALFEEYSEHMRNGTAEACRIA